MASGISTPVSSNRSYSDADVCRQSQWQVGVNKSKVAPLDELLSARGAEGRQAKGR